MELIIKNMFLTTSGKLIGKRDITITDSTTTALYDPAPVLKPARREMPRLPMAVDFFGPRAALG